MVTTNFDIRAYLDDRNITYRVGPAKNVASGWLGLPCIFCGELTSFHLGVNLTGMFFNCWRCGEKGQIQKLVKEIDQCSWKEAENTIKEFRDYSLKELRQEILIRNNETCEFPQEASKIFPEVHINYLKERRFDPKFIIKKYNLYAVYNSGEIKWRYRIIMPIYKDGVMVNFTARSVINTTKEKYHHCSNDKAIIPMKECLYNIDSVVPGSIAVIVEGPTDVWRLGDGCVATMGIQWTHDQVKLICSKKPKKVMVLYDSEEFASRKAQSLAVQIKSNDIDSEALSISEGDPPKIKF